jgi:hypothetical protein
MVGRSPSAKPSNVSPVVVVAAADSVVVAAVMVAASVRAVRVRPTAEAVVAAATAAVVAVAIAAAVVAAATVVVAAAVIAAAVAAVAIAALALAAAAAMAARCAIGAPTSPAARRLAVVLAVSTVVVAVAPRSLGLHVVTRVRPTGRVASVTTSRASAASTTISRPLTAT